MTNLERVVALIERHREARQWTDMAVARDMLVLLGVDPNGEPAPAPEPEAPRVEVPAIIEAPASV